MESTSAGTSKLVLFESSDGEVKLDVTIDTCEDEAWLNRSQMSLLFGRDVKTVGKHIANALKEELRGSRKPVVAKFATTATDGCRWKGWQNSRMKWILSARKRASCRLSSE